MELRFTGLNNRGGVVSEEEFEIVDDLPVPEESKRAKYPFSTARNRRSDKRFVVRRLPHDENSVGVWRTE